ncbi:glycerol dehydrogenase [Acetobacter sp.]|jgi:glucose dehydrogenase|uniref:glycerol dehydrogenase n=1 Tax=Acetobacter sp. TaxID=440 RepID=UPI0025C0589F|nr:glycerol dehydrogenase [Acetobacter sp.]MCH4090300.1 glycerol dehydrogenase [Acetobacter sp.]MCI1298994.1 glycerol dehydrogenase [Acetobacter sp.]MCI1315014.1 glycerol dehydrogenase [Acetobacter sp.]
METVHRPKSASELATLAVAILIVLLGLPLLIMGAQLAVLGGSLYYVLFGAAIIAGGILMAFGRVVGALVYLAAWICTWPWAFWEVGMDGWGLLPRLFGPSLVAVAVLLTIPVLNRIQRETSPRGGMI